MKFIMKFLLLTIVALASTASGSYPYEIKTSTPSAVYLRIFSYDNLNGRALQLRTTSTGRQIVVVDANSPVLVSEFRNGTIYSQGKTDSNQRYDLGPVAYLKNVSTNGAQSALQEFYFKNTTKTDPADHGFVLEFPTQDAMYSLYHEVPNGVVNGFIACKKQDYYQIYYNRYIRNPPEYKECTFLGVAVSQQAWFPSSQAHPQQTTLAPYIRG